MSFPRQPSISRALLFALLGLIVVQGAADAYTWKNVRIHGGGFVTGIVTHPAQQHLVYARTDVGGAYRWEAASGEWVPLHDALTSGDSNLYGVESLAVDPSDPNRVYAALGTYTQSWAGNGAMLRSADRGATWERTNLSFKLGGNETGRSNGERLAVDPNNGQILFFGSRKNGLWKSTDRGATWTQVTSFPSITDTNDVGIVFVQFIKSTGLPGNATPQLYAGVSTTGQSLFRSDNGGTSWQAVANQPTGLRPNHLALAANGTLYLTSGDPPGPNTMTSGAVWRYVPLSGAWTNISPATPTTNDQFGYGAVAVDGANSNAVMVATFNRWGVGDNVFRSTNGGLPVNGTSSWKALNVRNAANLDTSSAPWVASSSPHWMGDLEIDPFDSTRAWFVTGYGIFRSSNVTAADANQAVAWTFLNRGLEETVPLGLISPPSGAPLLSVIGDFDGFRHDDLDTPPAARHSPHFGTTGFIDFAEYGPNKIVRSGGSGRAAYSVDGGSTWTAFATQPANATGGGPIAFGADAAAVVWTPAGAAMSYATAQGAAWSGWTASSGVPATLAPVADRVTGGRFYAYDPGAGRLYLSTNGGANFAITTGSTVTGAGRPVAVPGWFGELWLPASGSGLYRTANSGGSFQKINSVQEATRVGFGKAAPGQSFPAVYLAGRVGGVQGVFRSDDSGATWTELTDAQHKFGWINVLTGDPRIYGRVYLGTGGRGILYGEPEGAGTLPPSWTAQDIGAPALAGSAEEHDGGWTVRGAGADIWGTSDQFHFVSQAASGSVTLSARVTAVGNTDP